MPENLEDLSEEDIQRIIERTRTEDPDAICLFYGTLKCANPPCKLEGYSGCLVCSSYINKRHLEFFKKYKIEP
jgi:hypothetical protein